MQICYSVKWSKVPWRCVVQNLVCQYGVLLLKYVNDVRQEIPAKPGIRCVNLPIGCPISNSEDQQLLVRKLKERPAATYVVCSCERCGANRNLLKAYKEALKVTPQV